VLPAAAAAVVNFNEETGARRFFRCQRNHCCSRSDTSAGNSDYYAIIICGHGSAILTREI